MRRQHFFFKPQLHRPYTPPPHLRDSMPFRPGPFSRPREVGMLSQPRSLLDVLSQPRQQPTAAETARPALVPLALEAVTGLIVFVSFLLLLVLLLGR